MDDVGDLQDLDIIDEALRDPRRLPARLWDQIRSDPTRAPEHVALAAAEVHGPAAAAWVGRKRGLYSYDGKALARMVKRKHASLARYGGVATGFGGIWTVLPDLAAVAWIQSRMIFFVAAAYGYDPLDRMRPAELLVLQGMYPNPIEARAALDGAGRRVASAYVDKRLAGNDVLLGSLLGVIGRRSVEKTTGKAIPGIASVFNAVGNERDTRRLADRAIRFYGG